MQFNKTVLLLGAGFSANFGGLLARDMWAKIFNNPHLDNAGDVKLALKNKFKFEDVYSDFFEQTGPKQEQFKILEQVLQEVYESMNDKLLHPPATTGVNINLLQNEFINLFTDDGSGGFGACFTLNQDLFFEKHFVRNPLGPSSIQYGNNPNTVNESDLATDKILPTKEELDNYTNSFNGKGFGLIKLHGSLNWKTPEGLNGKVIGINKPEVINKIPLLSWYRDVFASAVRQVGIKFVIYGYSFNDKYINDIMREAIHGTKKFKGNNMKIYIISREDPQSLKKRLEEDGYGEIWSAIDGYFPYLMKDMFPNEGLTQQYKELVNKVFT